jgi:hypothetical protein
MLAGYSFQDFELIESVFVASTTASVAFNNLNQYATEYKHLQLRLVIRTNRTDFNRDEIFARFNGDTGNNYTYHTLAGSGSAVSSSGAANYSEFPASLASTNNDSANIFGTGLIDITDAYSAKNKTIRNFTGRVGSSPVSIAFRSGLWMNTGAITSISLRSDSGTSFIAGSRFSLYGIR